ncbi:MAG: DRTGG domain-containing protein, partial [Mycobacteriaceae bacterium]
MARGVYVVAATAATGKSLVTVGLVDLMRSHVDSVGFFRPLTAAEPGDDPMVVLARTALRLPAELARGGISRSEARALLAAGERDEVFRRCISGYSELAALVDVVIIDGSDFSDGRDLGTEFDLNAELANHLGAIVVAVVAGAGDSARVGGAAQPTAALVESVDLARKEVVAAGCSLAAIIVNRVPAELVEHARTSVHRGDSGRPVYVLPEAAELTWPSVGEAAEAIGARFISGSGGRDRDVRSVRVAAMTVEHFLPLLEDGALVITPGDRADVLVATLAASLSAHFPVPAGVLLTGGIAPPQVISELLATAPFPVLALDVDTYSAARAFAEVHAELATGDQRKVAAALGVWARGVDATELLER